MEIERKALYNALRINAKDMPAPDPEMKPWQLCNYRQLSSEELFQTLDQLGLRLDKARFLAFAENYDTPEDLADDLSDGVASSGDIEDQIYLLLFELWRRYQPEKQSLSIFCDELDHCIEQYDEGDLTAVEKIHDAIANLQAVLDENVDEGADPEEVFTAIQNNCANDIEAFLYNYLCDQLEAGDADYAQEVFEGLERYMTQGAWVQLLKARLWVASDPDRALQEVEDLIDTAEEDLGLELYFELLHVLVQCGNSHLFHQVVRMMTPLLEKEEDFQDLLELCAAYYACLDLEPQEKKMRTLLDKRALRAADTPFALQDPDMTSMMEIISQEIL